MLIEDSLPFVILVGARINCVKPISCNIDLNSHLSDLDIGIFQENLLDESGGLHITKI